MTDLNRWELSVVNHNTGSRQLKGEYMFEKSVSYAEQSEAHQGGALLERQRLKDLLESAIKYPLVVLAAGSGYGKTSAVHSFLRNYDARISWLQISERDNVSTRYWENYAGAVSLTWPQAGERLLKIGFPDTDEAFSKFSKMVREAAAIPEKHIMVFDNFHLLHAPAVLRLIERTVDIFTENLTVILISRTMPNFNLIGMMMRENAFIINEDTLCFTEDEIAEYFDKLKLSASERDIRNIHDDTQGWAFAIDLIGRSLMKEKKYERYVLKAMKKNIFRFIEAEISQTISEPLWRFLLRISLIDHLAAGLIKMLAKDDALIKEMELINAYIRYDFRLDTYMIQHLFLGYLHQKQLELLTDEERRETYQIAGKWCDENGYHMDALSYYEKSEDYDAIIRKIDSFNMQISPGAAKYALGIFERAPHDVRAKNPLFSGIHIRLKILLGQHGEETISLVRMYAEDFEAQPESTERSKALSSIYGHWAILNTLLCTFSDVYDFDAYYIKMGEYYDKSPYEVQTRFSILPMSAWASLVGTDRAGAQEEYIDALSGIIPVASRVANGLFMGFDDLARGELCFYKGQLDEAQRHLNRSIDKARSCDQYITYNRALVYLMEIAFLRGDYNAATGQLQAMKVFLSEKDDGIRYKMYDIACGIYYLTLDQPEQVPGWLKGEFSHYSHPAFMENYENRVKLLYHFHMRQYNSLLAFIDSAKRRQTILFGEIELKVLEALALYQLKRRDEAIFSLTEAWQLSESNNFISVFTQHAKGMRTLTAAALRDENCKIPKGWLEEIGRKASSFAKRKSHMISQYMIADRSDNEIKLTKREAEILKDLSQGLSRTEIAASRNISLNTVKNAVNIIYEKLYANNLPEAIHIATSRKII